MTETAAPTKHAADAPFRRVAYDLRGGRMAGIAFGPPERAPDVVFLHATGLNARTYRTLLAPLGERLSVVALDFRGHGRTTLPAGRLGYSSWRRHRDDVIALLDANYERPVALAGHSMGGTVSLLVAGKRPDLVSGLVLVDPVIVRPAAYAAMESPGAAMLNRAFMPIARKAAERRRRFPDRAAAEKAFTGRGFFKTFPQEAIADYVADGFVDTPSGEVKLACSPAYEAATFAAQRNAPWAAVKRAPEPLIILRAERGSTFSAAAAKRFAAMRPDARIVTVEGASHALPLERPDRVRAAIESATLMTASQRTLDLE